MWNIPKQSLSSSLSKKKMYEFDMVLIKISNLEPSWGFGPKLDYDVPPMLSASIQAVLNTKREGKKERWISGNY